MSVYQIMWHILENWIQKKEKEHWTTSNILLSNGTKAMIPHT